MQEKNNIVVAPLVGLLAWLVPGLGHIFLGHKGRGLVFLVTITATFWSGVAIGGGHSTVDPGERKLWFVAQMGTGGNAVSALILSRRPSSTEEKSATPAPPAHWMRADIGVHYAGVAGLLNLLIILDALGRTEPTHSTRQQRAPLAGAGP